MTEVVAGFITSLFRSRVRPNVVAHAVVSGPGVELLRDLRGDATAAHEVLDGPERVGRLAVTAGGAP